jgi:TonB family protein
MKTTAIILLCLAMITLVALAQDEEPQVLKKVEAIYPKEAKDAGIQGKVVVAITIDKEGMVTTAMVVQSDNKILDEAALDAIIKWKFKPSTKECKAKIPFNFKLAG